MHPTGNRNGPRIAASRPLGRLLIAVRVCGLLGSLPGLGAGSAAHAQAEMVRPNFVFIIGDDISAEDIGCYGNPGIRTPNIDRLAAEGLQFTNAYLTISSCSPSRSSIITSRYPHNLETGDTVPTKPTATNVDLESGRRSAEFWRGDAPGAAAHALRINRPGPIRRQ